MYVEKSVSVAGNSDSLFKMAESLYTMTDFFRILNLSLFKYRNKFALAVICCLIYYCLSVSRKWINHPRFALIIYSLKRLTSSQ